MLPGCGDTKTKPDNYPMQNLSLSYSHSNLGEATC